MEEDIRTGDAEETQNEEQQEDSMEISKPILQIKKPGLQTREHMHFQLLKMFLLPIRKLGLMVKLNIGRVQWIWRWTLLIRIPYGIC